MDKNTGGMVEPNWKEQVLKNQSEIKKLTDENSRLVICVEQIALQFSNVIMANRTCREELEYFKGLTDNYREKNWNLSAQIEKLSKQSE